MLDLLVIGVLIGIYPAAAGNVGLTVGERLSQGAMHDPFGGALSHDEQLGLLLFVPARAAGQITLLRLRRLRIGAREYLDQSAVLRDILPPSEASEGGRARRGSDRAQPPR